MDIPKNITKILGNKKFSLHRIVKEYTIFIDSSFMMTDEAEEFFTDELIPLLKNDSKKIILAQKVYEELVKQSQSNNKYKTQAQVSKAKNGLKIISTLNESSCLRLVGSDSDSYVDNLFIAKFTELRLDQKLCLLTQDNALSKEIINLNISPSSGTDKKGRVRIKGIKVFKFNANGQIEEYSDNKTNKGFSSNSVRQKNAFSKNAPLVDLSESLEFSTQDPPKSGEKVFNSSGKSFLLGEEVGDGAEGIVFKVDDLNVCKIYKSNKFTNLSLRKLRIMTENQISHDAICWPNEIIFNAQDFPVGYLMKKAKGYELHKRLFFGPKPIEKNFPDWDKSNLVKVCLNILDAIELLHLNNVLVGDLNGRNIMVNEDCSVFIVDTDSFQLEGYPCPMGQITFTPPEIQKKEFKTFLRTVEQENFAIATLIFMILLPGKPPYAKVDGGMITDNIKKGVFSYPFEKNQPKDRPKGPWRFMWSHLPYDTKEKFYETFANGLRFNAKEWSNVLEKYKHGLKKEFHSSEINPNGFKVISDHAADTFLS